MKIDGNSQFINPDLRPRDKESSQGTERSQVQQSPAIEDRLEFSTKGRQLQELEKKVHEAPEIRLDKVDRISQELKAGTYNIKAEEVAEAIITGGLVNKQA